MAIAGGVGAEVGIGGGAETGGGAVAGEPKAGAEENIDGPVLPGNGGGVPGKPLDAEVGMAGEIPSGLVCGLSAGAALVGRSPQSTSQIMLSLEVTLEQVQGSGVGFQNIDEVVGGVAFAEGTEFPAITVAIDLAEDHQAFAVIGRIGVEAVACHFFPFGIDRAHVS
jgi:hypothetical protein